MADLKHKLTGMYPDTELFLGSIIRNKQEGDTFDISFDNISINPL